MRWENKGHQFDNWGRHFEKRSRILIYGAGMQGIEVCEKMRFLDCIDGFIDNDESKQISGWHGLTVYPPETVTQSYDDKHLIIIAIRPIYEEWRAEAERILTLSGYIPHYDFFYYEEFFADSFSLVYFKNFLMPIFSVYAQNKVYVQSGCVIPSTVCNLKCANCLNFTPELDKKKRHSVKRLEDVKQEVDLFFKWVDFTPRFQISGGEPILYKNFTEIVEYIGNNYRNKIGSRFETVLNGTVMPSDEQCRIMHKYNMLAIVDNYEENVPLARKLRSEILEKLNKFDIQIEDNYVQDWFDLKLDCMVDVSDSKLTDYFDRCGNPWNCLSGNKLFACNFERFAEVAGIVQEGSSTSFDLNTIITTQSKRELVEFVLGFNETGYVEMCRHCAGWAWSNGNRIPVAIQSSEEVG